MSWSHSELFEQGIMNHNFSEGEKESIILEMQSKLSSSLEQTADPQALRLETDKSNTYVHLYTVKEYFKSDRMDWGISKAIVQDFEKFHEHKSIELETEIRRVYEEDLKNMQEWIREVEQLEFESFIHTL